MLFCNPDPCMNIGHYVRNYSHVQTCRCNTPPPTLLFRDSDISIEISVFIDGFIQIVDALVYKLYGGGYVSVLPFVVIIGGLTQDVIDNISLETGTGNYQNIIIAHKTGADTVFDALVVVNVCIPGITSVENDHLTIGKYFQYALYNSSEVIPFLFGKVIDGCFHSSFIYANCL